jgi:hypothetical protein
MWFFSSSKRDSSFLSLFSVKTNGKTQILGHPVAFNLHCFHCFALTISSRSPYHHSNRTKSGVVCEKVTSFMENKAPELELESSSLALRTPHNNEQIKSDKSKNEF